jgi:hypothetical protein
MQLTEEEIQKRADDHAARVKASAAAGGCPKCGCMTVLAANDPVHPKLMLCHGCGNKFE